MPAVVVPVVVANEKRALALFGCQTRFGEARSP